ncbi:MAG: YigZ family protein [Bacilli bacterium]|nr:YigZ family protein [Bacilli bacterium]
MKTILENKTVEIEVKNSRFITKLIRINNSEDIKKELDLAKEEYPKATHYCYAFRTLDSQKSSDDGEPGGTAGIPMLNVLIKENLINVLAITIRYFGGIKLGAGGLVRAYTKSLTSTLQESETKELIEGYLVQIETNYESVKKLDYILKDNHIIDKKYEENITYLVELPKEKLEELNSFHYKILENRYI